MLTTELDAEGGVAADEAVVATDGVACFILFFTCKNENVRQHVRSSTNFQNGTNTRFSYSFVYGKL